MGQGALALTQKHKRMCEGPLAPLIIAMALPSIASNLISTIYNLADTYFISHISTAAAGAIAVGFVFQSLIQAIGFYFGQGSGTAISQFMGKKNLAAAEHYASLGLILSLASGLLLAVVGHLFLEELCILAGASQSILPYAKDYLGLILYAAPWMAASLCLNMQLRFEGEATSSALALMAGALLNIFLAPFFMFHLHLEILGAALATALCQLLSFFLLLYAHHKKSALFFHLKDCTFNLEDLKLLNRGGIPSLFRQLIGGFAIAFVNDLARPFGDTAIASLAIVSRLGAFANYVQIGIGQGFQPVCGFNYGAGLLERVRRGYYFCLSISCLLVTAFSLVAFIDAEKLVSLFSTNPQLVQLAALALRFQCLTLPISCLAMITNFVQQITGHAVSASFLGVARLGVFLVPVSFGLSRAFGLNGLLCAQAVSDLLTFAFALPMCYFLLKELESSFSPKHLFAQLKSSYASLLPF